MRSAVRTHANPPRESQGTSRQRIRSESTRPGAQVAWWHLDHERHLRHRTDGDGSSWFFFFFFGHTPLQPKPWKPPCTSPAEGPHTTGVRLGGSRFPTGRNGTRHLGTLAVEVAAARGALRMHKTDVTTTQCRGWGVTRDDRSDRLQTVETGRRQTMY